MENKIKEQFINQLLEFEKNYKITFNEDCKNMVEVKEMQQKDTYMMTSYLLVDSEPLTQEQVDIVVKSLKGFEYSNFVQKTIVMATKTLTNRTDFYISVLLGDQNIYLAY